LIQALQTEREAFKTAHGGQHTPILIKIAPDLSEEQIRDLAGMFSETKIDGVIASNTTIGRAPVSSHPLSGETGGLSGAPLRERSTEVIRLLRDALDDSIPIIGVGGILSADDAKENLLWAYVDWRNHGLFRPQTLTNIVASRA
jgi:dihydroorotate dehydrogenase